MSISLYARRLLRHSTLTLTLVLMLFPCVRSTVEPKLDHSSLVSRVHWVRVYGLSTFDTLSLTTTTFGDSTTSKQYVVIVYYVVERFSYMKSNVGGLRVLITFDTIIKKYWYVHDVLFSLRKDFTFLQHQTRLTHQPSLRREISLEGKVREGY